MEMGAVRIVEAGEVVFNEGEKGERMYVLLEGSIELKVKVDRGEAVIKVVDTPNDFFGEMALIDGRPRSATAVAAVKSKLLAVDGPTFEAMIVTNGKFALKIIKVLSQRLRSTNEHVEDLIETGPKERITRGMSDFAARHGEVIHDGSYKVKFEDMRTWINGRLGFPLEDIDLLVYRLLKAEAIAWAATSAKTKEHLLLPEAFVRDNDRRD